MADNLVTSAALAATCPLVVAPAMNNHMWEHPATRANLELLRAPRGDGRRAGRRAAGSKGEWGAGRLAEPAAILAAVEAAPRGRVGRARRRSTACACWSPPAGTREPIDAVRYIGNRSSGRMGFALASVAAELGADVTVLAANVELARDPRVPTSTWRPRKQLRRRRRPSSGAPTSFLMAAAVVDFRPALSADHKIKKSEGQEQMRVDLELTPDILSELPPRAGRADRRGVRRRARRRRAGYGRDKLRRKGSTPSWSTTSPAPTSLRRRRERGRHRDRAAATRRCPRAPRRMSPAPCSTRSSRCAPRRSAAG
jgi:phosphopantothenoylcysteine decarboxylase/phosphopantothenate--cysteine ligase